MWDTVSSASGNPGYGLVDIQLAKEYVLSSIDIKYPASSIKYQASSLFPKFLIDFW